MRLVEGVFTKKMFLPKFRWYQKKTQLGGLPTIVMSTPKKFEGPSFVTFQEIALRKLTTILLLLLLLLLIKKRIEKKLGGV